MVSPVFVLYGSETGTAEEVADSIGRALTRHRIPVRTHPMNEVDPQSLRSHYTVFIVSTTGQGHAPKNMLKFWQSLLPARLPSDYLSGLEYTIFGLGDSTYPKFNWPAKKLWKRLSMLGATPFWEKEEGDDQNPHGLYDTFLPWMQGLLNKLEELFPLPPGQEIISEDTCLPSKVKLKRAESSIQVLNKLAPTLGLRVRVVKNERVTAKDHFQDTREITLESDEPVQYAPGDAVEISPLNSEEDVSKLLSLLGWENEADLPYEVKFQSEHILADLPNAITIRELFTKCLDIASVPRRSFLEWLVYFVIDLDQKEKLREMLSPQELEMFYDYITRPRRTIIEVLEEFKAIIPIDYVLDVFPALKPRQFSIASSVKTSPNRFNLLIAIVSYKTIFRARRKGVATSYVAKLQAGDTLSVSINPGTMKVPQNLHTPIIIITGGTGIAPFKSFLDERATIAGFSDAYVFLGIRSAKKDFYYESYFKEAMKDGLKLFIAPSRDQDKKVYVQHKLSEQRALVWSLVSQKFASIYLCGSSKNFPEDVKNTIREIFMSEGEMSQEQAQKLLTKMEAEGRFQEESW